MSHNESYLKPLLALSGNARFAEARTKLIQSLSEHELQELIQGCLMGFETRESQEEMGITLLDLLVKIRELAPENRNDELPIDSTGDSARLETTANLRNSKKRPVSPATSTIPRKRAKDSHETAAEGLENVAKGSTIKHEPVEVIEISDSEEEEGEIYEQTTPETPLEQLNARSFRYGMNRIKFNDKNCSITVPKLKIGILTECRRGYNYWKPICSMMDQDAEGLHTKFISDYLFTNTQKDKYLEIAMHPGNYLQRSQCVNSLLNPDINSGDTEQQLDLGRPNTYTEAEGDDEKACDRCIKEGRLCVNTRLLGKPAKARLCVYPLPNKYRENKLWRDLSFWVIEKE